MKSNKEESTSDKQALYITHLSKSVGEACDRWLERRGMKGKSWKQQQVNFRKKKN